MSKPRKELTEDNFEIYADEGYMIRPPMSPTYLFMIDISSSSFETGYLRTICECISSILQLDHLNERSMVGFILFDTAVHFVRCGEMPLVISFQANSEIN